MKIGDILNSIPTLFTYFIPGYIVLYMKSTYLHEKSWKETHLFLISIIISFIIRAIIDFLIFLINIVFHENIVLEENIQAFVYIIAAIIISVIFIVYRASKVQEKINELLNNNVVVEPTVWCHAMKCKNGGVARVYQYDNDVLYVGNLINYTLDPDDEKREILLSAFEIYKISDNSLIEDNTSNPNAVVLLQCNNLSNIEIFKG